MLITRVLHVMSCCCYHKGTYFQANHNPLLLAMLVYKVVVATTKVRIFKQITTNLLKIRMYRGCCCYHKGTYFQANHNYLLILILLTLVVVATTKVRIFKQITTQLVRNAVMPCCCCYHKGTYFQANHNPQLEHVFLEYVVVATTKVRIFKQITTGVRLNSIGRRLLLLPQRYVFSSKSQQAHRSSTEALSCCCYHKGTYFQANHNYLSIYHI